MYIKGVHSQTGDVIGHLCENLPRGTTSQEAAWFWSSERQATPAEISSFGLVKLSRACFNALPRPGRVAPLAISVKTDKVFCFFVFLFIRTRRRRCAVLFLGLSGVRHMVCISHPGKPVFLFVVLGWVRRDNRPVWLRPGPSCNQRPREGLLLFSFHHPSNISDPAAKASFLLIKLLACESQVHTRSGILPIPLFLSGLSSSTGSYRQ